MRRFFEWVAEHIDARDVHAYFGIFLVALGLSFVFWPAAFFVPGFILLFMALRRVG